MPLSGAAETFFGFRSEEKAGNKVRMHFETAHLESLARWLLSYGNAVQIEKPERLKEIMVDLAAEIQNHYLPQEVER
jgi:predicted DNA-binding transcriptional regulator YafY